MTEEFKSTKIMTKPLPQILDEIEGSISKAEKAAQDARKAAEEARQAGEKAAGEAAKVAKEAIAEVRQVADEALNLANLLKSAIIEANKLVDNKLTGKTGDTRTEQKT